MRGTEAGDARAEIGNDVTLVLRDILKALNPIDSLILSNLQARHYSELSCREQVLLATAAIFMGRTGEPASFYVHATLS